jgi:O-antigen/teichoic acid export membrane protein
LLARVAVAVVAATLSHDTQVIIWSLVALEGVRLLAAACAFVALDRSRREPALEEPWRAQLRFCVPSGLASLLAMLNRNLSSVVVARVLGPAALAQYAIGRFGEPVVVTLRNSVSAVVLPEMVRNDRQSRESPLLLWKRATVINAIFLFPLVVLVARYAQPLVTAVFGSAYHPAALVMQLYMVLVIRECFDFAPALRALNRTRPLVESNVAALLACGLALPVLIPIAGVAGAMLAFALGACVDVTWLAWRTMTLYGVRLRQLVPWGGIVRTALAAGVASVLILTPVWTDALGSTGIAVAAAVYLAAFAVLLLAMRVPEALTLRDWGKKLVWRSAGVRS